MKQKRYPIYLSGHRPPDKEPRVWVPILQDPELARLLIESFTATGEHSREGNTITVSLGFDVKIRCEAMEKVLNTPLTGLQLSLSDRRRIVQFKYSSWEEQHEEEEKPESNAEEKPGKKDTKPTRGKKPKKPEGYVTISELCKKWGIKPLHARQFLRVSELEKPEYGWSFDPKLENELKKICGVK